MLIQDLVLIAKSAQSYIKENRANLSLTGIEQTVCMHIYLHCPTNQDQLARLLMMNKGNMARTLAALEKQGFIHREENPKNRRQKIVSLTPQGEDLIQAVLLLFQDWEDVALKDLSAQDAAFFKTLCSKISGQIKEER